MQAVFLHDTAVRFFRVEDIAVKLGELSIVFFFPLIQSVKICHSFLTWINRKNVLSQNVIDPQIFNLQYYIREVLLW